MFSICEYYFHMQIKLNVCKPILILGIVKVPGSMLTPTSMVCTSMERAVVKPECNGDY